MISYSGLTTYGKASMAPPVGWNGSSNIKREPPKSVISRRKENVFDTNDIAKHIAESYNISEAINKYPRGVNQMVSVSYGEAQTAGNTSKRGNGYLPYTIINDGAFRPVIKLQRDLLPLSRLPREWTTVDSRPEFTDYSKSKLEAKTAEQTQQVHNKIFNINHYTRKIFVDDAPEIKTPNVNSRIQNVTTKTFKAAFYDPHEVISDRPTLTLPD